MLYDPKWTTPVIEEKVKTKDWRQVLREAADLIETEGWITGNYHLEGSGYCAVGAISAAADSYDGPLQREAYEHLRDEINRWKWLSSKTSSIVRWNDFHAKNATHVIKKMRLAAER